MQLTGVTPAFTIISQIHVVAGVVNILSMPTGKNNEMLYIYRPRSEGENALGSVCASVRLGVPRAHYTPLQRYMGYLCTRKAQYAPESVCLSVRLFALSRLNRFKVFVCASVISGPIRIIARMRSIGVLML